MKKRIIQLFLIFVLTLTLTSCKSRVGCEKYSDAKDYKVGDQTYKETISKVEIDWSCGEVKIVESTNSTIKITESDQNLKYDKKVHSLVKDGVLYVKFWKSGLRSDIESEKKFITIQVPSGKEMNIDSISADVISDKLTGSNINIKTVSGNINIKEVKTKTCDISTTSGDVSLNKVTSSTKFDIETVSGKLNIGSLISKNITANSVSGDVKMELESFTNIEIKVTSSKVNLLVTNDFSATLTYKTTSGKLNTSLDYRTSGSKRIFGEGTCNIYVKSVSGNLNIN